MRARYRYSYRAWKDGNTVANGQGYSMWSDVIEYNASSRYPADDLAGKKVNEPILKKIADTDEDFAFSVNYGDEAVRLFAEKFALHVSDNFEKTGISGDYYYDPKTVLEIKVNDGEWLDLGDIDKSEPMFSVPDYVIQNHLEEYGLGTGSEDGDTVYFRVKVVSGAYEDDDGNKYPDTNFIWSDYSEPVAVKVDSNFNIYYELNDGEFEDSSAVIRVFNKDNNDVIDLTDAAYIPVKNGFEFGGWFADEELTILVTSIDLSEKKNINLYAKWDGDGFSVEYVTNAGDKHIYNPNATYFTPLMDNIPLEDIELDGLNFAGWYADKQLTQKVTEIDTSLAKNLVFYAKWDTIMHSIKYHENGGKVPETATWYFVIFPEGEFKIQTGIPVRAGYIFDGWYTDEEFTDELLHEDGNWYIRSTAEKEIYAKWIKGRWNISYVNIGMEEGKYVYNDNPESYTAGDSVTLKDLEVPGWIFKGWFTDKACTNKATGISATDTGAKTFYAKWEEQSWKITYVLNDDKAINVNPESRHTDDKVELKPAISFGSEFLGWYRDVNFKTPITEISEGTAQDITVYAKWYKHIWGDADKDGAVNVSDARLVLRKAINLDEMDETTARWVNVDLSPDGKVTVADARLVLRMAIKLDTVESLKLPATPPVPFL